MSDVTQEVREFIVETFLFGEEPQGLGAEDSLLDQGIIDSTGVLELVGFLESTYGLTVEDHELVPDNLDSLSRIAHFVEKKQHG